MDHGNRSPRLSRRAITALAGVLLLTTAAGCKPWLREDDPAPWIAANTRAVPVYRQSEGFGGVRTERVWRDPSGRSISRFDTQDDIREFMLAAGMFNNWPESNFAAQYGTARIAPFRFVVVSINPTVVLMTPFEFGSPDGRSLSELIAPIGDKGCLGIGYMVNDLECDITAIYAPDMQWFSHDLKQQPAPITWRDGRAELPLRDEVLVLTHDGKTVQTERQQRSK